MVDWTVSTVAGCAPCVHGPVYLQLGGLCFCFMLPSACGIFKTRLAQSGSRTLRCVCGVIETSARCSTGNLDRRLLKTVLDNCKAALWQIIELLAPLMQQGVVFTEVVRVSLSRMYSGHNACEHRAALYKAETLRVEN